MHSYGLSDNPCAVIAAQVTFATPFAILILQLYAILIPFELDDAALIDICDPTGLGGDRTPPRNGAYVDEAGARLERVLTRVCPSASTKRSSRTGALAATRSISSPP
jgi:hypothetical protein